jgi:ABC-type polysaccharide/polyol phosphate transport system ATPase subunit
MSDIALRIEHVYKKFRKGETFNSLRDLIPALTGRMFRQEELSDRDKREFWALQDISFEVKRGEALGIIGHNGAGKSTILKILSRIMKPTRGRMEVNGRLSALIEVAAGFHQDLTGRENIYLNGTILGMNKREIASKFDQIVAFSGLEEFIDTPVKRYSSGMYARLGFSVAAHVDPEVLIVDEVLSVGDYVFQNKCVERMKEVIRNGATVLFVSHNLKTITEFCQRCLLLERGRERMFGSSNEVVQSYLNSTRVSHGEDHSKPVHISRVYARNANGTSVRFESGETVWIDIELTAREACQRLAVVLLIMDESHYEVFNTSTERLGCGNFNLDAGDRFNCSFELRLNFANGTFHLNVVVYRYDTQTEYDRWDSGSSIYVGTENDARGAVNCFPKVVKHEIVKASTPTPCQDGQTIVKGPQDVAAEKST